MGARTNTDAVSQAEVDHEPEMLLAGFLIDAGIAKERAGSGRIGVSILIATQQLERPVDRPMMATFDEYQRWLESVIERAEAAPVVSVVGRSRAKR